MIKEIAKKKNKIKLEEILNKYYNEIEFYNTAKRYLTNADYDTKVFIDKEIRYNKNIINKIIKNYNMENLDILSDNKIWNLIVKDYEDYIYIKKIEIKRPYASIEINTIHFNESTALHPCYMDLIQLLHEIGHVMTNDIEMECVKKEYLATQWAFNHMKKYNIKMHKDDIYGWQNYIYTYLDKYDPEYNNKKELYKLNIPEGILF